MSNSRQSTRVAAIYARVSSERQRQAETIQSQLAALRELAAQRRLRVPDELVFCDDGFPGARLNRPALERLRDRAAEGAFELLLCHSADRLARRYAYQVLLLEELQRVGVELIFAKEPERSGSPEDELLRQFQGMIGEYERAQIAERTRRGTLHRARAGSVTVLTRAPYGYRYIKKSEHADAFFEIDEAQARVVREIFRRYAQDGESVGAIARALSEGGIQTKNGGAGWNQATIWGMLRNPAYAGRAAYGKKRSTGEPARLTRTTRQRGERHGRTACERVAAEQWTNIPVPALIDEETFALAQQRLERGKRLSPRNTRRPSLLQGILVCGGCGYAYYRSQTTAREGRIYHYYRCSGSDASRRPHGRVCSNRPARLEELDELVWAEVLRLLEDPSLIQAEIQRRLQSLRVAHPASQRRDGLERELVRARRAVERLIEAYQEQLITLEELRARTPALRQREATLQAELGALDAELQDAETFLKLTETLESFRARLAANAEQLTIEQRQQIVRLVVREVLVGDDRITIRHSIPTPQGHQPPGSSLRLAGQAQAHPEGQARPRTALEARAGAGDGRSDLIAARHPDRKLNVVGDSAYGSGAWRGLGAQVTLTVRPRKDAALYELAPPRTGRRGRPALKGARLPGLAQIALDAATPWQPITARRYGKLEAVEVHTLRCLWHGTLGYTPVGVLLVRDTSKPTGYQLALLSTDLDASPAQLIERYGDRWPIEVSFEEGKQLAGVGQARNRTKRAVERTVPFQFLCMTLTILWYALHGDHPADVEEHRTRAPWYQTKTNPSFADMLAKLRRTIIAAQFSPGRLRPLPPENRRHPAGMGGRPRLKRESRVWGFHLTGPPGAPGGWPLEAGWPATGSGRWAPDLAGAGVGDDLAVADGLVGDGELEDAVEDESAAA